MKGFKKNEGGMSGRSNGMEKGDGARGLLVSGEKGARRGSGGQGREIALGYLEVMANRTTGTGGGGSGRPCVTSVSRQRDDQWGSTQEKVGELAKIVAGRGRGGLTQLKKKENRSGEDVQGTRVRGDTFPGGVRDVNNHL